MPARILIVHGDPELMGLLRFYLASGGYSVISVADAQAVREEAEHADLVLLDLRSERLDGQQVARVLKAGKSRPALLALSTEEQLAQRLAAISGGADAWLPWPADAEDLRWVVANLLERRQIWRLLDRGREDMEKAGMDADWVDRHGLRVAENALLLGRALSLGAAEMDMLYRGAVAHDMGKIGVPREILAKPGALTAEEWVSIKKHVTIGESVGRGLSPESAFLGTVRSHHERWDGTGYPDGLAGEAIPYVARIVAVADTYDALVSQRAYRQPRSQQAARRVLEEGAGTQWDAHLVERFLAALAPGAGAVLWPEEPQTPGRDDHPGSGRAEA